MASLVLSDGSGNQMVYPLEREQIKIGRSADNDVVSMDLRVSRHHASIIKVDNGFVIKDEGSTLGVFVNQSRIDEAPLHDGDIIRIGDSNYSFVDLPESPQEGMLTISSIGIQAPSDAGLRGSALVAELQEALGSLRNTVLSKNSDTHILNQCFGLVDLRLDGLKQRLIRIERARIMMQTLYEVGKVLNSSYDRENLFELILDQAVNVVRAERGFLALFDSETKSFERRAAIRMAAGQSGGDGKEFSKSIALTVAQSGNPIVTTDALSDDRFREKQSVVELNIRSALCVPLVNREDRVMGVIYIDTRASVVTFTREDQDFLMAFANYASIAIENAGLLTEAAARVRAEEELRLARKMDEMKSQMLSMVSHDVRTPLTSIKSFAEILYDDLENLEPDEQRHFLGIINRESDRLSRLVTNFLDLQKIEAGHFKLSFEDIEIGSVVRDSVEAFEGAAMGKKITVSQVVDAGLPRIRADRDRLLQVLANLMSNALKFTPEGGIITVVADEGMLDGKPAVRISVKDTGSGIPAEKLEAIFEPFEQVGEQKGGTGLGLVLCREIASLHGGRITASSHQGQGTSFRMVLPVDGP